MPTEPACPKCGSHDIIPSVRIIDRDDHLHYDLSIEVERRPEAWVFKGAESAKLLANICGRCGAVELFVENPAALLAAYREQQQTRTTP